MRETEWNETWEDASGGKWDVSFCLLEKDRIAFLDVHGFHQAGVGNFRFSCGDYIPKGASGHITEENYGFINEVEVHPPDIRGKGLGSVFVKYMMEWMRERM